MAVAVVLLGAAQPALAAETGATAGEAEIEKAAAVAVEGVLQSQAVDLAERAVPSGLTQLLADLQSSGDLSAAGAAALSAWFAKQIPGELTSYATMAADLLAGRAINLSGIELPSAGGKQTDEPLLPAGDYLLSFEGKATLPELEMSLQQLLEDTGTLAEKLSRVDSLEAAQKLLKPGDLDPRNFSVRLSLGKGLSISRKRNDAAEGAERSITIELSSTGYRVRGTGLTEAELANLQEQLDNAGAEGAVLKLPPAA